MEELCMGRFFLKCYPVVFTYSTGRDLKKCICNFIFLPTFLIHLSAQYFTIITQYFVIPYVNPYTFLSTVMQLVQCDAHSEYEIQRCSGTRWIISQWSLKCLTSNNNSKVFNLFSVSPGNTIQMLIINLGSVVRKREWSTRRGQSPAQL